MARSADARYGFRSEVLGQFAMVNVELLKLVDDIKPILRMYVVYPKNVNAENAPGKLKELAGREFSEGWGFRDTFRDLKRNLREIGCKGFRD